MGRTSEVFRYHRPLFDGFGKRLVEAHGQLLTYTLAILCVLAILLPEVAAVVRVFGHHLAGEEKLSNTTRFIFLIPMSLLVLWKLMEANWERFKGYEKEKETLENAAVTAKGELEKHYIPRLRPRVTQIIGQARDGMTHLTIPMMVTNEGADTSVIGFVVHYISPILQQRLEVIHPKGEHFETVNGVQIDCSSFILDRLASGLKRGQTVYGRFSALVLGDRIRELDDGAIVQIVMVDHLGNSVRLGSTRLGKGGNDPMRVLPGEPIVKPPSVSSVS